MRCGTQRAADDRPFGSAAKPDRRAVEGCAKDGAAGIGLAGAVLHDAQGPFGTCAQSLFVERRA